MSGALTDKDIRDLLNEVGEMLISIYVDTMEKGNPKNNRIKFKDLISRAKINLKNSGYSPKDIQKILDPAYELEQDDELWLRQKQGLAVFLGDRERHFLLDSDMPNLLLISNRYHLKPLIRFKRYNKPFWILYLDKSDPELYRASRQNIRKIEPSEMSKGLSDIMQSQEIDERTVQFHTKTRHRVDQRSAVHHGQGEPQRYEDEALRKSLDDLNTAIIDLIDSSQDPLIIAGEGYLNSAYRKTNSYEHLIESGIEKNINFKREEKLHEMAVEILLPKWRGRSQEVIDEFNNKKNTDMVSNDLQQIVNASYAGKVNNLLIKRGVNVWGVYINATGSIRTHVEQMPESVDLLSLAAEECYKKGKDIYFLDPEDFPSNSNIAAILYK